MFTLVPVNFFSPSTAREALSEVAPLPEGSRVSYKELPTLGAVLIYEIPDGADTPPEIFGLLEALSSCKEYNKVLCSWKDGSLNLVIAQGRSLLLANEYPAPDFVTAQYYIFLGLRSLQLNPEITTIRFSTPLTEEEEMMLYRYFKSVDRLQ